MSIQVIVKGIVRACPEATLTQNGVSLRRIIVTKPAFTDEFGEKKGNDQDFEIAAFSEAQKKIPAEIAPGAKVSIKCYLNSKAYITSDTKEGYNLSLSLGTIEILK